MDKVVRNDPILSSDLNNIKQLPMQIWELGKGAGREEEHSRRKSK